VAKLNASGSALVYSTYLGGSGDDYQEGIAVDSSGNAHVTGYTTSTNFPTASPLQASRAGFLDAGWAGHIRGQAECLWVSACLYSSTYLGAQRLTFVRQGIAVDSSGNAYVTGASTSTNFPTASPLQASNAGFYDGFVAKLSASGTALLYATYLGGSANDGAGGIAVDSSGNAYVAGYTESTNFPTASPLQASNAGGYDDAFVAACAASAPVLCPR
jgi:hypothetical protein